MINYPQTPIEQPIYILPQNKKRVIIPQTLTLFILGILFYLGILLNISLLDLLASEETTIQLISLILLILIIIMGIFNAYYQSSKPYTFYKSSLQIKKKTLRYVDINTITQNQNFFDKLFQTYSLTLNQKILLENIPQEVDVQTYLNQLIEYSKKTQQSP